MNTRLGHDAGIHWENLTGRYVSLGAGRLKKRRPPRPLTPEDTIADSQISRQRSYKSPDFVLYRRT